MNALCYKVIFSKRLGALVAVGENATSQGKSASGAGDRSVEVPLSQGGTAGGHFVGTLKVLFASSVLACMVTTHSHAAPAANTLPTGYSVNSGNVAVSATGANMTIKQNTDKASVNWQSFSIGSAASVNIQQNSASSVLLNRVVGNDPSQIFGKLTANGQVILINPNGIVFGKGGSVTASAFTASTFGMSEEDFKKGKYKYDRNGSKAGITVEEGASINTTVTGGYVALISATVNNQGNISTKQGPVILAAGESVALPSTLTDNVGIPLSGKVRLELAPSTINASVENGGTITTEGGQVLMQAAAVADAVASVTHTGAIDTTGAQGGAVTLLAEGGHIKASGSITANSIDANNKGGDIIIGRDEVTGELAATTDVSGAHLESKGGFIETSGDYLKTEGISVKAAEWLLDPSDITISNSANNNVTGTSPGDITPNGANGTTSVVQVSTIQNAINQGTSVTIKTTNGVNTTGAGNITIANALAFDNQGTTKAALNLIADNGIIQNAGASITTATTSKSLVDINMTANGNFKGIATPNDANSKGITLNSTITTNGAVALTGTTSNSADNGVTFANGSGISAATYTVTGANTSTAGGSAGSAQAAGVLFRNTTGLTSTTGASSVTGDTRNTNGHGVMFYPGNSTLDAGSGSLTVGTASTSVTGIRSGWGGSSTINTKGNVTLGSKNNNKSDLMIQGVINAQSGALTLLGKSSATNGVALWDGSGQVPKVLATNGASITINGESSKAGAFGVILAVANQAIVSSDTGAISITGTSSGGTGVYTQNNTSITSSSGGSITLTGNATGSGGGVGLNLTNGTVKTTGQVQLNGTAVTNVGVINNAAVTGGSVSITGTVSGNAEGVSVSNSGAVTATAGNVNITGSSGGTTSGGGVYSSAAITSNTGDVNITGTTLMGGGVTLDGTVTAQNNVTIEGTSSSTASGSQGVVIRNAVKANTGDITVTGNTNSNIQRAVAITNNVVNNVVVSTGSLQTVASGRNININADTLLINGNVDSGTSGTVTVKTTSGNAIALGVGDTTNSTVANRVLGIEQSELNFVKAGKLIIGDTTTGGNIRVASAVTTADTTGNLFLKTAGNVNIDNNLTVGTTGGKNLSIEATGTNSTVGGAGAVKANELKIKGSNATVAMATAANQINTISADVKSLTFKNGKALSVGKVFASTTDEQSGIKTTGVTSLTVTGSVTQTSAAAISADGLELLGDTADFTLNNASNAVNTVAASTKSVSFINSKTLTVDQVNNTKGITTSGNTTLTTTAGDLTLKRNITASNSTVSLNIAGAVLRDANAAVIDGIIKANALKIKANSVGTSTINRVKTETSTLAMDTAGDQYVSEADGVTLAAKTSGGKIDVETRNGTLTVGNVSHVDGANIQGLTKTGSGDITLSGNSTTGAWGVNVTSAVNGGGDIKITGQSNTGPGTVVSANVTGNQNVEINGTSNTTWGLGVQNGAVVSANGPINLTGTTGDGKDLGVLIWGGSTIQANAGAAYADGSNAISIRGLTPTNSTNGGRNVVINSNSKIINNSNNGDTFIYGQNSAVTFDAGTAITNANTAGKIKVLADNNARVDATDPSAKITQNSNKGVSIISNGNGDVVVPSIVNNGTGDVVIAAGSTKVAGDGSGGQVKTSTGQTITNNAGKTYIYTGSASDTGKLEDLMGSLATLYLSKGGDNAQNAQLNTAYANSVTSPLNTIQNGAAAQVMFRENTKFDEIQINPATLTMNAGQVDPSTASFAAVVAAANTNGAALTKANITANKFKISTDAAGIAGTLPTPSNQARTTGTYDYATTSSIANKVTSSISSTPAVKLVVQASNVIPVPTPVVPTSNTTRVKVPAGSANPFALASAESLVDDVCSSNSLENCHCEESSVNVGVSICYEPNAGSK